MIEVATPPDPRHVAARWKRQYERLWDQTPKWRKIYDDLSALDPKTREGAEAIIGNQSWTRLSCSGCNEYVDHAVRIGEDTNVCAGCARAALDMLGKS